MNKARIGLVLAGGMAKGAYQIGALKALQELIGKDNITSISSASIGVLNSFAFSSGNIDEGIRLWKNILGDDEKKFITSLVKGNYLEIILENLLKNNPKPACELFMTLYFGKKNTVEYVNLQDIPSDEYYTYLKSSVTMPVISKGIRHKDEILYDGAIIDNIPVNPLVKKDLDYIICIYFDEEDFVFESPEFDSKIIRIICSPHTRLKESVLFEKSSIANMVDEGYEYAKQVLSSYLVNGMDDIEFITGRIKEERCKIKENKMRVTGDFMVTKINKIAQKLIKVEK